MLCSVLIIYNHGVTLRGQVLECHLDTTYLSVARFISNVSIVPVSTWNTYNMTVFLVLHPSLCYPVLIPLHVLLMHICSTLSSVAEIITISKVAA